MPRTPPPPLSISRPGPQPAHTAQRPPERPCTYLMQRELSSPLDSMHGRRKSELPHNGAQAPQSSACFPPPLLLTHAKLRRRGPISLQGQHAGGGWEEGWPPGSIACLQPHMVSRAQKKFEGGEGKQGDPGVPISGPRLARWY